MDGGAWWAAVHGVAKSWTQLSIFTFTFHFHTLEKEMATHSSVLAWRIPGVGEPHGLLSMWLHRVRHDWNNLAAAADTRWTCPLFLCKTAPCYFSSNLNWEDLILLPLFLLSFYDWEHDLGFAFQNAPSGLISVFSDSFWLEASGVVSCKPAASSLGCVQRVISSGSKRDQCVKGSVEMQGPSFLWSHLILIIFH